MQYNCKKKLDNQVETLSFLELFNLNEPQKIEKESFLFITAHDDDPLIGAGMLISIAKTYNIKISIVIITNGCQGYQKIKHKGSKISKIRVKETYEAYKLIGVTKEDIYFLEYPDSDLVKYIGRRDANVTDYILGKRKFIKNGSIGILNSIVYYLRKLKATKVFIHTNNDFHPDHKLVFEQTYWGNFFSASNSWPDLKSPLGYIPEIFEYFVYSALSKEASIQIESREAKELRDFAISKYKSQGDIHGLVSELESAGPYEWFCKLNYKKADRLKIRDSFNSNK